MLAPEDSWSQGEYDVRFDWGPIGAARLSGNGGVVVVVDVLSFTTSVTVAVERGISVYPAPWRDSRSQQLADEVDAVLATGRRASTPEHPWSLSPAALMSAPIVPRLVLPSPNGSAIAAAAAGTVVAGCLRNADAIGRWLRRRREVVEEPVNVIAAGERWPDGSLRPGLEDLLGAGAVIAAMAACNGDLRLSPEAAAAGLLYRTTSDVPDVVRTCASGIELTVGGFADDVEIAADLDSSDVVSVMIDRAFRVHDDRGRRRL